MQNKKAYFLLSIILLLFKHESAWAVDDIPTKCCQPSSVQKTGNQSIENPYEFKQKYPSAIKILDGLKQSDIEASLFDNLKKYLETDFKNPVGYTRDCIRLTKAAKYAIAELKDNTYAVRLTRPLDFQESRNIDSQWLADLLWEEYPNCIKSIDHGCLGYGDFGKRININDNEQYILFTNDNSDAVDGNELGRVVKRSELMSTKITTEFLNAQGIDQMQSIVSRGLHDKLRNQYFLNYPEPDFAPPYFFTPYFNDKDGAGWQIPMDQQKWFDDSFTFKAYYYNEPSTSIPKPENSREYYRCEFKKEADNKHYLYYVRDGKKVNVGGFMSGPINYVVDCMGRFYIMPMGIPLVNRKYHSMFLGGAAVIAAGTIKVDKGIIVMLDNDSGHYAPSCESLEGAIRNILINDKGYQMDFGQKQTTDQNGNMVTLCKWTTTSSLKKEQFNYISSTANHLSIYPNPSIGIFTLELPLTDAEAVTIEVYSEIGKSVYKSETTLYENEKVKIDLSENLAGIYTLRVVLKDRVMVEKLVLRR